MNTELADLLRRRHPLIFAGKRGGIMCGDGWFDLIDVLCERLQFWTDHNRAPQVVVSQVKEKWGELSFYNQGSNQEQDGMIVMAEEMSTRICEKCGRPGRLQGSGEVMFTRCLEHTHERACQPAALSSIHSHD
jgi:hypothetical protein